MLIVENCATHRPKAWEFQETTSGYRDLRQSFERLFQIVMRRQPSKEESESILVMGFLDCVTQTDLCLSRFSGATRLELTKTNKISAIIDRNGYLIVTIPRTAKVPRHLAKKYMMRVIVDAILRWANMPIANYRRGRIRVLSARLTYPESPQKLIYPGTSINELRRIIARILVGRLSISKISDYLDSKREEHVLGILASMHLGPNPVASRIVSRIDRFQ